MWISYLLLRFDPKETHNKSHAREIWVSSFPQPFFNIYIYIYHTQTHAHAQPIKSLNKPNLTKSHI